jgi:hypothetical protein
MSTSTEYMDGLNASVERRFYPRVTPPTPIYVAFGSNNLGVLHDVSENGFQVATPDELAINSVFRVSLSLNGAPKTISVTVRTIWTDDASRRSGIQLLDLSDEDRQQIRKWIVFEMSRNENPNAWYVPKNGERRAADRNQTQVSRQAVPDRQPVPNRRLENDAAVAPAPVFTTAPASAPASASAPVSASARVPEPSIIPGVVLPVAAAPISEESQQAAPAHQATASHRPARAVPPVPPQTSAAQPPAVEPQPAQPTPVQRPASDPLAQTQPFAFYATVAQPSVAEPAAAPSTELPPIANPFDDPGPNSPFQQFPSVPLPIHGEFEYAKAPASRRRRSAATSWYSQLRTKPLILWAATLAVVCFGANALVRYKIKHNAARFANESAKYTPPTSDAATPNSGDDSGASANAPSATDAQSAANGSAAADPNDQSASSKPSTAAAAAVTAPNDSSSASSPAASRSTATDSSQAQPAPRRESSLDARDGRAYAATAPPSSDRSEQVARGSQPTPTPRTWSAPAPSRSSSASTASASDAPQSPNVVSSSNAVPSQSAPAPVVTQTRPTPPPPTVQASNTNTVSASAPAPNSNNAANNTPVRTQPPANSQPSTYASNANTSPTQSQSQSRIYNANAPAQRSAIIGSINSVHSSGIFESNDSSNAAQPSANSRGGNANAGNANTNVAARPVASNSVVPADTPQERDIEITAPKGFTSSYVDLPGEHVVRAAGAIVHMRRSIRVPGERVPGQRWLWRGRLNVTLGDVVTRIDPAVVQASGASGSLTVQATIDKDGYVTDLKPLYGNFAMLPSVSRAVRNWRYEPTYLDSKRAETQAQIEFDLRPATAANAPAHR